MMADSSPKKILIVDDEAFIRLLIEQTLEDLEEGGVQILTARNGTEALKVIQEEKPLLVFLDVMMPMISGYEVCRTVKHDLDMQEVFVVLLTAKGQELDQQIGKEAGADLYMTKPFDPDELLDLAKQILSR
jgi:CheY-like chemotaxis protein